jgi:transposase
MDLPMHGKRVGIQVTRHRYQCQECGHTFYERLPHTDDKRGCTARLVDYIEKKSLNHTFASLAEEIGLDEKTIRNIFRDYVNRLEKDFQVKTPQWLGIDEIHIIKPRCVVTNIKENTVIDILRDRNKSTVVNYLQHLPDRQKVRYVAMDMWSPYRDAVRLVLPQATIVVDKFHVVRMANQALDTVRKSLRQGLTDKQRKTLMHDRFILLKRRSDLDAKETLILESWIGTYKDLGLAHDLKETFYEVWDAENKGVAMERLQQWQDRIPEHLSPAFKDLLTALKNWQKEIFAYFDHRITNAYTESLNGLIRIMNRLGTEGGATLSRL